MKKQPVEEEEDDEFEARIKRTQCYSQYEALQECYFKAGKDWRQCQKEAQSFKRCFQEHLKRIRDEESSNNQKNKHVQ